LFGKDRRKVWGGGPYKQETNLLSGIAFWTNQREETPPQTPIKKACSYEAVLFFCTSKESQHLGLWQSRSF